MLALEYVITARLTCRICTISVCSPARVVGMHGLCFRIPIYSDNTMECFMLSATIGECWIQVDYGFTKTGAADLIDAFLGGQANVWSELLYFGRLAEHMLFP